MTYISGGRHPVAESEHRKIGKEFIANDTVLDVDNLLHIVTGPNMYVRLPPAGQ